MNERIQELYNQAIMIEDGGELDPEKFAALIVLECVDIVRDGYNSKLRFGDVIFNMKTQLGVEE